nr:reverse transcriptase domain-containing protein [Tanacetum cinerariifolium]
TVSPTADSPGYIPESDPDKDSKEDDDEDLEEDPADYPADDDDDDEEEEPSGNDADKEDEEQDEDDDDEEEEHPTSTDSIPPPPALPSPPILPIPLPAASPPLQLLSSDRRVDRPEVTLPPRKRLSIIHCPGYEARESSTAVAARPIEGRRADYGFVDSVEAKIRRRKAEDIGYGIRDTWIDPRDVAEEEALTTLEGVNTRVTELAAVVEALVDDSQYYYEIGRLVDQEAIVSREAWAHSIGLSSAGHLAMALGEIRALQTREQARTSAPEGADVIFSCDLKKMAPKRAAQGELQAHDANRTSDDNHTSRTGVRRTERVTRECTYQDFMKCQPLYFKGTEGVVELTQWFERIETVFHISKCLAKNQVKFATCTLLAGALTWWNSNVRIPPKRQDVARAYAAGSGNRQQYAESRPMCPKCNFNHDGPCIPRRYKCNKIGHLARDCRSPTNANVANNQRGNEAGQKATCYECGAQGHFKRNCPKLINNNNNHGNQVRTGNAQARLYTVGNIRANPDANTVT